MITKVRLKNFQVHKNRVLEFTEGVNIIRGSSDAGKSAIIRAMIACITGKDFNSAYQTWGTNGPMEVTIEIDGHVITRGRDAKSNYYILDGKKFAALRGECPKEISKIFNIGVDQLNSQYESFYLLSETAGGVAKKIQAVCDLDSIARISKVSTKAVSDATTEERIIERKLSELEPRLQKLDDVVILRRRYQRLVERGEYLQEQESTLSSYEKLKAGYEKLEDYKNSARAAILRPEFNECAALDASIKKHRSEFEQLLTLRKNIDRISEKIKKAGTIASVFSELSAMKNDAEQSMQMLMLIEKKLGNFERLKIKYANVKRNLIKSRKELSEVLSERDELFKEIKVCPLCGAEL